MTRGEQDIWHDQTYSLMSASDFADYFLRRKSIAHAPLPDANETHVSCALRLCSGWYTINGETHRLTPHETDWLANPSGDKEWLIALHKHYFAVSLIQAYRSTKRRDFLVLWIALTESWIAATQPGCLPFSDAHVEAKRIESWIMAYLLLRQAGDGATVPGDFLRRYLERLNADVVFVRDHLRSARNHRTFQLYSMFLVGTIFPEFQQSEQLAAEGREKLIANLTGDFTPAGVHIERSTHYHNITLETALDFVLLANANGIELPVDLLERLRSASNFSAYFQFPDGEIPLINDSDNGSHQDMLATAAQLFNEPGLSWAASRGSTGNPPLHLARTFDGYFVLNDHWGHDSQSFADRQQIFLDCAPLGEGSHSHYDLFNFCWYAAGKQIIVDPGRYTYNAEPGEDGLDWRREFKSTRFHNTVEIDGRDQTRYLSKAKTVPLGVDRLDKNRHKEKHGPEIDLISCSHHFGSYSDWVRATARSHEYSPLHERTLLFVCRQYLIVADRIIITDDCEHRAVLRFHLGTEAAQGVSLENQGASLAITGNGFECRVLADAEYSGSIAQGWTSKTYGIKERSPVIEVMSASTRTMCFYSILIPDRASGQPLRLCSVSNDNGHLTVEANYSNGTIRDQISGLGNGRRIEIRRRNEKGQLLYAGGRHNNQDQEAGADTDTW